jgi:oxygen-dependent protoporphyrinogen oxidase
MRTPSHLAALRGFIVGAEADNLLTAPDEAVIDLVQKDFSRWMGTNARPLFSTIHRWPDSMPQYVVGHGDWREKIAHLLEQYPGLHLAGNAYDGVGIPDCIRLAQQISKHVLSSRV